MGAVGLQTHIWANNTRSILLLVAFPVLMIGILYGVQLILMGFGFLPGTGKGLGDDMALAASWLGGTIPLASFWAEHRATRRVRAEHPELA